MIQVSCPSCQAEYSLDERRVPATGQKMRCPKCNATFLVHQDGQTAAATAPAVNPKKTMLGVGPKPAVSAPVASPTPPPLVAAAPEEEPSRSTPFDSFDMPGISSPPADDIDADLPGLPGLRGDLEIDLPSPRASTPARSADHPAPKAKAPSLDFDLPTPKTKASSLDLDLPAPKTNAPSLDFDLPAAKTKAPSLDLDLPAPRSKPAPMPSAPAPARVASTAMDGWGAAESSGPSGLELADLDMPPPPPRPSSQPSRALGDLDLPGADAPLLDLDLPPPAGAGAPSAPPLGDFELPMPKSISDLPPRSAAPKTVASKPPDKLSSPPMRGSDLPPIGPAAPPLKATLAGPGPLPAPAPPSGPPMAFAPNPPTLTSTQLSPGASASEVSEAELPSSGTFRGGAPAAMAATGAFEMQPMAAEIGEFEDLPQEAGAPLPAIESRAQRPVRPQIKRKRSKAFITAVSGVLGLAVVVGVLAGLFTQHGYFGIYWFEQLLPAAGSSEATQTAIAEAEKAAKTDSYEDVRQSLRLLAQARQKTGLNRALLARSLLHESLYQVRFGEDPASASRAAAILGRLEERGGDAPGMALARAADALRRRALPEVAAHLTAAAVEGPSDPYVELVAGELALRQGSADAARAAFERAAAEGAGVRALWGRTRALILMSDPTSGVGVDDVLGASPRHGEARLERATLFWRNANLDAATPILHELTGETPVEGAPLRTSRQTRAGAYTLLGRIQESRGDRWRARAAYEAALQWDSLRVEALLGAGRLLLSEERYQEAMLRFQAAAGAAPAATSVPTPGEQPWIVQAKLGEARSLLGLDRVQDARGSLQALQAQAPTDGEIALWLGKTDEKLGDRMAAETNYRRSIDLAPEKFDGYLALSQLYFATDRMEDAATVLTNARARVRESPSMRRMLGQSELVRNRPSEALREFERALELDPTDMEALFGRGVSLRRVGRVDDATVVFDQVAARDSAWPGLALERGMLFESRGLSTQAVDAYREALKDRPDDPDLLIRLSSAEVSAGHYEAAEESVRRVVEARPNSAEGEYLLGRVAFARADLPTALRHFERAVSLDATRGEFFLYLAWALLESGSIGSSLERVEAAIERDGSLPDAYLVRGRIRLRTGAVRGALEDLQRALNLNPDKYEAYAYMGEGHDQLRNEAEAIRSYRLALEHRPERGDWWYRLGRLLLNSTNAREATHAFERATTLGAAERLPPSWLPDAHRLYGDGLRQNGNRVEAAKHYRRYLAMAPDDAVDRANVEAALRATGG